MRWQFSGDAPIYTQLIRQIREGIASGVIPAGERLPAVRELAAEAGVNPNTMQRALSELERDGLVYAQRTAGRFVTEERGRIEALKHTLAKERIRVFLSSMESLGFERDELLTLLRQELEKEEE